MADEGFFAEIEGLEPTERAFALLLAGITDLRPFWPLLVPAFIRWMREQFDSEGDWGGAHWEPLSEAYAAWKMEHYPGKPILQATGDLRQAASRPRRRATPNFFELIIDDSGYTHQRATAYGVTSRRRRSVKVGAPRSIAPYHQFGGGSAEIGGQEGRPPRREIIPEPLPIEANTEIHEIADGYIRELARRVGLAPL